MPRAAIVVESEIVRTPRVVQCEGIFDVPPSKRSRLEWQVNLPIEERDWHIGLIVGPSGSGKSTVARALWPAQFGQSYSWPDDKSVLDGFPAELSIKEIVELLSSVGFSSPPSWVRPFRALSNGEQFRVTMARVLAESAELAVVDEFTSVVDRTVAQIGSAAIAKTVRRRGQRFVAVTCHEDVEAWLQPDWVYRPATNEFSWRSLQRRPAIELTIRRVHSAAWELFRRHHYLDASINKSAACFCAFWQDRPVAFSAWLAFPHPKHPRTKREHRTVTLPDYQGVGIGNALSEYIAAAWRGLGYRAISTTSHPAMIHYRARSPHWKMTRPPSQTARGSSRERAKAQFAEMRRASSRLSAGFEYVGPALPRAEAQLLIGQDS